MNNLSTYGIQFSALKWMENYHSNRQRCVQFYGMLSDVGELKCGIPQGSCLGPLLYGIFTNELPNLMIKPCMAMYANDTTIYISASNLLELNESLQEELMVVCKWVDKNKLN